MALGRGNSGRSRRGARDLAAKNGSGRVPTGSSALLESDGERCDYTKIGSRKARFTCRTLLALREWWRSSQRRTMPMRPPSWRAPTQLAGPRARRLSGPIHSSNASRSLILRAGLIARWPDFLPGSMRCSRTAPGRPSPLKSIRLISLFPAGRRHRRRGTASASAAKLSRRAAGNAKGRREHEEAKAIGVRAGSGVVTRGDKVKPTRLAAYPRPRPPDQRTVRVKH
jgi:hypothetical protein